MTMFIKTTKEGQRWVARFPYNYETKELVKQAGFRWEPVAKYWWTTDPMVALKIDPDAAIVRDANAAIVASRATSAVADIPVPAGLAYLPYQLAGIKLLLERHNALLADEMGLGKTIQVIGLLNADPAIKRVLVVCPASLKINWVRELTKWLVEPRTVGVVNGVMPQTDIVVINFDILTRHRAALMAQTWDLLVVDESHKIKNAKAQRTVALLGRWSADKAELVLPVQAKRKVFLTGTPIVNRPAELWTTVKALEPAGLGRGGFKPFGLRYCDGHLIDIGRKGMAWDYTGASHLDELQQRLRSTIMIRRLKADVLTELPAKRRQVVLVPPNSAAAKAAVRTERAMFDRYRQAMADAEQAASAARARGDNDGYAAAVAELHSATEIAFEQMSAVRHETAVAKIDAVIEHLTDVLETQDKVVVFCHHHDVAHALAEHFGAAAAIVTGEVAPAKRQAEVDRFQHDPACKLFIGGIQAAGVGLTLTAAQHVVFAEMDWVPGNVSQAEDRLHRIGQQGSVLVQHLVFDDSVDALMAQVIIDKQQVIEAAMDKPVAAVQAPVVAPVVGRARLQPVAVDVAEPMVTRVTDINRPADDRDIPF